MVLRFLASQPDPVPLERLASALDLPRSTAYHLVNAMIEQGFVTHIAEERRYCLGVAAFEVGIGYARQAPLQRLAHRPLAALVDRIGHSPTWPCHTVATSSTCSRSALPAGRPW